VAVADWRTERRWQEHLRSQLGRESGRNRPAGRNCGASCSTALFARNAAAGRLAIRRIQTLFRERRSFAVETTLAGRSYPRLLVRAKSEGWSTGIAYVGVATPDLAIERVRERVSRGGHDVPPMDVRRRYQRSLINLVRISKSVDRLVVLDNSSVDTPMQRVLESQNGVVAFALDQLPEWVEQVRDAILAP
jgi:predicted ABC-type ATPase